MKYQIPEQCGEQAYMESGPKSHIYFSSYISCIMRSVEVAITALTGREPFLGQTLIMSTVVGNIIFNLNY